MKTNLSHPLLEEFTGAALRKPAGMTTPLRGILLDIVAAGKLIHQKLSQLKLNDMSGTTGDYNIHEEEVQKMDFYANTQLIKLLQQGGNCAAVASEEMDEFVAFNDPVSKASPYVVVFDPLDGSNGIDANTAVGTIFGIYRRISASGTSVSLNDFLQPGKDLVAAGYLMYSAATIFVYASDCEVNGFTLDPYSGLFRLSHYKILCPQNGGIMSINPGSCNDCIEPVKQFIQKYQSRSSFRYGGSLVTDVHRILLKGGLFLYPATKNRPDGKLRLVYECNPIAFLLDRAGGFSMSEAENILAILPYKLHQTIPFFTGSKTCIAQLSESLNTASRAYPD